MMPPIAPPLRFTLRASRRLRLAIVALSLVALLAVYLSRLPLAAMALVPFLAWWAWWQLGTGLPLTLLLRGDGSAARLDDAGAETTVTLRALHERGPLGVLELDLDGRRLRLAWAGDSLARAARRELRLWMRDHAHHPDGRAPDASSPGNTTSPG